jgi:hypothetical protein
MALADLLKRSVAALATLTNKKSFKKTYEKVGYHSSKVV